MRFFYENPVGRLLRNPLFGNPILSRLLGWQQDQSRSHRRIRPFVERFGIDLDEVERPLDQYPTFNAFFARRLKPGARPSSSAPWDPARRRRSSNGSPPASPRASVPGRYPPPPQRSSIIAPKQHTQRSNLNSLRVYALRLHLPILLLNKNLENSIPLPAYWYTVCIL